MYLKSVAAKSAKQVAVSEVSATTDLIIDASNRRCFPRSRVDELFLVEANSRVKRCILKNVSSGGVCLVIERPYDSMANFILRPAGGGKWVGPVELSGKLDRGSARNFVTAISCAEKGGHRLSVAKPAAR